MTPPAPVRPLSRNREFAALWVGQTISEFGTSMSTFAYPLLVASALWLAGVGAVFSSVGLVTLVLAQDAGAGDRELGVMFSLTASGGFVGAFLAPWLRARVRPGALVLAFGWISAVAAVLIVLLRSPYALGIAGAAAFLLFPAVNAVVFGHLAATVPDHGQGRVNGAVRQVVMVLMPVGPVAAGLLIDGFGPVRAAGVYAVVLVGLAVVATVTTAIRRPDAVRP